MELNQKFKWQNVQGHFSFNELYDQFVRESNKFDKFVDIGGSLKSISYLATRSKFSKKNLEITTINYQNENFLENTTRLGISDSVTWLKIDPISGANYFKKNSLFAVLLNNNYDYNTTIQLVKLWLPKIKKQGYIAGTNLLIPSVELAIESVFPNYKKTKCVYPAWFIQV